MRLLKFNVIGQTIDKDPNCDFDNIVAGSKNYLKAYFNFSEEWKKSAIAISFWRGKAEYAVILKGNTCDIPKEVLTGATFKVSATRCDGTQLIPTNKVLVRQEVYR